MSAASESRVGSGVTAAALSVVVFMQAASEHVVLFGYFWQPPAPSHLPLVPQVVGP